MLSHTSFIDMSHLTYLNILLLELKFSSILGTRTRSFSVSPVQEGYVFVVLNPEGIMRGEKPQVREQGPYVYSSTTVKDSDDNMVWHDEDGTLEYRPREEQQETLDNLNYFLAGGRSDRFSS